MICNRACDERRAADFGLGPQRNAPFFSGTDFEILLAILLLFF
jgi:hypothetical protein